MNVDENVFALDDGIQSGEEKQEQVVPVDIFGNVSDHHLQGHWGVFKFRRVCKIVAVRSEGNVPLRIDRGNPLRIGK